MREARVGDDGTSGWFATSTAVLGAGTGESLVSPLNAFDRALHKGKGAGMASINLMEGAMEEGAIAGAGFTGLNAMGVTSVIPPRTRICRMISPIEDPVDVRGMHAPAVFRSAYAEGETVVTAGVGIGVPDWAAPGADPEQSGVIFHTAAEMTARRCIGDLRAMVTEGMNDIRGGGKWNFYHAVATSTPDQAGPGAFRCAVAVLLFLTPDSEKLYENVVVPVDQVLYETDMVPAGQVV